jgi:SAM-dependent methyltransferase
VPVELAAAASWKRMFEGVDEGAAGLYLVLEQRLRARGLGEALAGGWTGIDELRERLGYDARVAHRFRLALAGLRNSGALELDGERVRARRAATPAAAPDERLIEWTYGPIAPAYRQLYETETIFDPDFALAFDPTLDELWDSLLNAPMNALPRDAAIAWAASPGARVLDLAFGTPHSLRALAGVVGEEGRVDGLDVAEHFVRRAREELDGVAGIGRLLCADANDGLGAFGDAELDGVVFMGALHFVDDEAALVAELARVTRAGARVAVGMFFTDRRCYAGPSLHLHRSLFDPPGLLRSERDVVDALRRAGFEVRASAHVGAYCTLLADRAPEVRDP